MLTSFRELTTCLKLHTHELKKNKDSYKCACYKCFKRDIEKKKNYRLSAVCFPLNKVGRVVWLREGKSGDKEGCMLAEPSKDE
jgi:hypothetical protein